METSYMGAILALLDLDNLIDLGVDLSLEGGGLRGCQVYI